MEWLNDFRYDRPGWFWSLAVGACLTASVGAFFLLPRNEFFGTVGVTAAQQRAGALHRAIYWQARAAVHASDEGSAPEVFYGNLLGIEADARIIVSVPIGDSFQERRYRLADVLVHDVHAAARIIATYRLVPAKFDIYEQEQAVIWLDQAPLNVRLIEEGAATPDPNPPTNIVDIAFARYYWGVVKGERK